MDIAFAQDAIDEYKVKSAENCDVLFFFSPVPVSLFGFIWFCVLGVLAYVVLSLH